MPRAGDQDRKSGKCGGVIGPYVLIADDPALAVRVGIAERGHRQVRQQEFDVIAEVAADAINHKGAGQVCLDAVQQSLGLLRLGERHLRFEAKAVAIYRGFEMAGADPGRREAGVAKQNGERGRRELVNVLRIPIVFEQRMPRPVGDFHDQPSVWFDQSPPVGQFCLDVHQMLEDVEG